MMKTITLRVKSISNKDIPMIKKIVIIINDNDNNDNTKNL